MVSLFNRWRKNNKGVAAIEFALVGIPFFMALIGILETTLFFAAGNVLEGAAQASARVIRTGQAEASADPMARFEESMCSQIGILVPCANVSYEVIEIPDNNFTTVASYPPSFDVDGVLESQGFSIGGSESIILVRLVYTYNFMTPFLGTMMDQGYGDNSYKHISTVVVRNEPYAF